MKSDLERAAEILDQLAQSHADYYINETGEWDHESYRLEHDEYRDLANRLRKLQA